MLDFPLAAGLSRQHARARCSDHAGHLAQGNPLAWQSHELNAVHLSGSRKSWQDDHLDVWQQGLFGMQVTCACFTYKGSRRVLRDVYAKMYKKSTLKLEVILSHTDPSNHT